MTLRIDAISVIPEVFELYMHTSIMGRAQSKHIFEWHSHNLRDWTHDPHRTVDDKPFGGNQGMLMKPEPLFEAIRAVQAMDMRPARTIFFSPAGRVFSQAVAEELARCERILFVCGRYEGIDERVYMLADDMLSLGDFILTGAELACMTVTDAAVRLLPDALGNKTSAEDESFSDGLLEYAQYTRPASFEGMEVPEVLRSGNHQAIAAWQRKNALERTARLRPDLLKNSALTPQDQDYLNAYQTCLDKKLDARLGASWGTHSGAVTSQETLRHIKKEFGYD